MLLQCPKCAHLGKVPDHLGQIAQTARCRRCNATFPMHPRAANGRTIGTRRSYDAAFSAPAALPLAPAHVDDFFSGTDDDADRDERGPSSGDSHYEFSAILDDGSDGSDDEMPAFDPRADHPAANRPDLRFESGSTEILLPNAWYYQFIDSWGRFQFFTALGFAAASLSVLGYLLARAIVSGEILSSSTTALILGCVGTIAFLLLSLSATALIVLLVDLAKNVRQLIQQTEQSSATPGDRSGRSRPRLSQPVA